MVLRFWSIAAVDNSSFQSYLRKMKILCFSPTIAIENCVFSLYVTKKTGRVNHCIIKNYLKDWRLRAFSQLLELRRKLSDVPKRKQKTLWFASTIKVDNCSSQSCLISWRHYVSSQLLELKMYSSELPKNKLKDAMLPINHQDWLPQFLQLPKILKTLYFLITVRVDNITFKAT